MYEVDERDRVVPLGDLPQTSIGAPLPLVLADEHVVVLAYYLEESSAKPSDSLGFEQARAVGPSNANEPMAIVRFETCFAHMFGPIDDSTFECICESFGFTLARGSIHGAVPEMIKLLRQR
jgi:hypothetical protein